MGMYVSVFEPYSAETKAWFFRSELFKQLCVNLMAGCVFLWLVGAHHERAWSHAADVEKLRLVQHYNKVYSTTIHHALHTVLTALLTTTRHSTRRSSRTWSRSTMRSSTISSWARWAMH
jgi:hypothetical protein